MKILLILTCVALASNAFGTIDPDPNSIGVYFDTDATINCGTTPPGGLFIAYLCATNISESSGISGWECNVEVGPGTIVIVLSWNLYGNAINITSPPNFVVGLGSPLPWAPSIVLMDILLLPVSPDPFYFTLHPAYPSSFNPPSPGYAAGNDPGNLIPLDYSVGSEDVCAIVNGDCYVVGNEELTWGGVKALYR